MRIRHSHDRYRSFKCCPTPLPIPSSARCDIGENDEIRMQSKTARITSLVRCKPKRLDLHMTLPYMMPEDLKRQLVAQEARSREQLSSLAETAAAREAEASELRLRAQQLQEQCDEKEAAMARLYREMETAQKQSELLQQKLRQLEEDIAGFKRYNAQLTQELQAQQEAQQKLQQQQQLQQQPQKPSEQDEDEEDSSTASETEDTEDEDERKSKLHKMEEELRETRSRLSEREAHAQELAAAAARAEAALAAAAAERDALNAQRERLLQERKEEMGIVQKALEEAQAESAAARRRFEQDFERLRTVHSDRETQLLEDFEWKLREVQQACKRRIEDKEKTAEARVQKTRQELEQRLASAERRLADLYDTQRALRAATKDVERAHDSERRLKEEVQRLGQLVETERSFAATLQRNYDRLVAETERKLETRAQELQDELTEQWEQKSRGECARLRTELAQLHAEEVALAVAAAKSEAGSAAEAEYDKRCKAIERRATNALNEVTSLRARMAEKESEHARELEAAQSRCDSTVLELRRKFDKLDMQYQEKIEKLQEEHEKQIERMTEEQERRVAQVEAAWQAQASSTRATLELVKEQLEREAETRLEVLERKHQKALEEQWERLNAEHERTLEEAQNRHREQLERLRKDLERVEEQQQHQQQHPQKEQQHQQPRQPKDKELEKALAFLRQQLEHNEKAPHKLNGNPAIASLQSLPYNQEMSSLKARAQRVSEGTPPLAMQTLEGPLEETQTAKEATASSLPENISQEQSNAQRQCRETTTVETMNEQTSTLDSNWIQREYPNAQIQSALSREQTPPFMETENTQMQPMQTSQKEAFLIQMSPNTQTLELLQMQKQRTKTSFVQDIPNCQERPENILKSQLPTQTQDTTLKEQMEEKLLDQSESIVISPAILETISKQEVQMEIQKLPMFPETSPTTEITPQTEILQAETVKPQLDPPVENRTSFQLQEEMGWTPSETPLAPSPTPTAEALEEAATRAAKAEARAGTGARAEGPAGAGRRAGSEPPAPSAKRARIAAERAPPTPNLAPLTSPWWQRRRRARSAPP